MSYSPKMAPTAVESQAKPSEKSFMCKIPLYPQTAEKLFGPLIKQPLMMKTNMCEIILNPKSRDTPSYLASRRRVSRKEEPVNCAYCGTRFLRRKYLNCHLQLNRCKDYDSTAGKRVADSGSQDPNKKNVTCTRCGAIFLKKKYLVQHQRKKRCKTTRQSSLQGEKRYHCTICAKGFTYQKNFYRHQNICHKPPSVLDKSSEIVIEAIKERESNVNNKQVSHSEIIESREELEKENIGGLTNKKTLNNLVCKPTSLCELSNKETDLEARKKIRYHCSVCKKIFKYKKAFEKHQNLPCNVCYKRSKGQKLSGKNSAPTQNKVSSAESGQAHHCETENFVESANSPVVSGDFETASFLGSREKEADCVIEKMSYHCSVCEEDFYDQKQLERHQSVSGSICYKPSEVEEPSQGVYAFDQNETLNIDHQQVVEFAMWVGRLHQKESSKGKTYTCFVCQTSYIYKKNLFRHIKRSRCKRMYLKIISPETLDNELRDVALEIKTDIPLNQCHFSEQEQKIPNPIAKRKAYCPSCLRVFSTKSNLYKHCRLRRCKFELNMETLKQFQVMHGMKGITNVSGRSAKVNCQYCGVLFRKRKYLFQHLKLNRCKIANILAVQAQSRSPTNNNGEMVSPVAQSDSYQIETLLDQEKYESDNVNSSYISYPNSECETWSVEEDIVKEEIEEIPSPTTHEQIEFTQEQIELMLNVKEETGEFLGSFIGNQEEEGSQVQSIESGLPGEVIEDETRGVHWAPLLEQADGTESVAVAERAEKEHEDVCEGEDASAQTQNVEDLHNDMSYCDTSLQNHEDTAQDGKNYEAYRLQECALSGHEWASGINGTIPNLDKPENKLKRRRSLVCYHCGQSFVSTSNLNRHFRMYSCRPYYQAWKGSRWADPVTCRDCGTHYLRFKYFLQHKKLNRCNVVRQQSYCLDSAETEEQAKDALGNVWGLISSGEIHVEKSNVLSCKSSSSSSTGKQLEPDSSNTHLLNSRGGLLEKPLGMKDQGTTGIVNISSDKDRNEELENCEDITEGEAIALNPSGKSNEPRHLQVDLGAKLIHEEENLNPSHQGQEATSLLKPSSSQALEPENNKSQACKTGVETSLARKQKEVGSQGIELKGTKNQTCKASQPDYVNVNPIGVEPPEISTWPESGNAGSSSSFDVNKQIKSSPKKRFHGNASRHDLSLNCNHCEKHFFSRSNLNRHCRLVKCKTVLRNVRLKGNVRADKTVTCADCGALFRKKKYMIAHKKLRRCKMYLKRESLKMISSTNENTPDIDLGDVANHKSPARKNYKKHKASRKYSVHLQEEKYLPGLMRHDVFGAVPVNQDPPGEGHAQKRSKTLDDCELDKGIVFRFQTKPNSKSQKGKEFEADPNEKRIAREENNSHNRQNCHYQTTNPNEGVTCADCGVPFRRKKYLVVHKKLNRCKMSVSRVDENGSSTVVPGCSKKNASSSGYSSEESFHHFLASESLQNVPLQIWSRVKKLGILGEKPYECQNCSKGFFYKRNLYRHLKLGRCKSVQKCPFCDVHFFNKKTMAQHLKYELQNIQNSIYSHNENGNKLTDQNCSDTLSQGMVNKNQSIEENSLPPQKVGENQNVNTWVDEEIKVSLDESQISKIILICPVCRNCFSSQCELKLHIKEHSNVKKLQCLVCNAKFCDKFVLDCHLKIFHTDRDCLCKACNKDVKGYKDLHLFLPEYENGKPYECPLCDKKFCRYRSMLRHVKIHLRKCSKKNKVSKF